MWTVTTRKADYRVVTHAYFFIGMREFFVGFGYDYHFVLFYSKICEKKKTILSPKTYVYGLCRLSKNDI